MQFKCSSCQAKYQIADEKVAGKTVRMKCRKCGAPIEVRARVTEAGLVAVPVGTGESAAPPSAAPPSAAPPSAAPPSAAPPSAASPPASAAAEPAPAPSAPLGARHEPPHPPTRGAPPAPRPATAPARPPGPPPPSAGVPPRRPPAPATPRPSEPGAPKPLGVAPGLRPFGPAGGLRQAADQAEDDGATTILARDLLGLGRGGFAADSSAAPKAPPAAGRRPEPAVPAAPPASQASPVAASAASKPEEAEEWFVGIAGRPVGPKPRSFLAERLAAGEINGKSLVWREDFTDWRPLEGVPALASLVAPRVGAAPAVASEPARQPPAAAASDKSATTSAAAPVTARSEPTAPSKGPSVPPPAPSAPVALVRVKEEDALAFDQGPAGLAASAATARAEGRPGEPLPSPFAPALGAGLPAKDDHAKAGFADGAAAGLPSEQDDEAGRSRRERRRRSRGVKPVAWAFVAMAGAFGAVAAYVVFMAPPSASTDPGGALSSDTAAATGSSTAAAAGASDPGASSATHSTILLDPVSVAPGTNGSGQPGAVGTGAASPGSTSDRPSDLDLSGFNTAGPSGPSAGPGSTAGSESRGELTSADISSVVSKYKGGVSRKCLPLVEAGGAGGATSARVVAHLVIGPSGDVQSASASGGKEFPGLADCVAARVRTWKFPASNGTTPVDVPFHFIAQ